jgi:putative ABC transport system permease protein
MLISKEIMEYSLRGIKHRIARTVLTILSIFVGIAVIFVFISFGLGLYHYVDQFSTSSSADKLMITAKGSSAPGLDETFSFSEDNLIAVERSSGVYSATGMYAKAAEVKQDKIKRYVFVIGYDPEKPLFREMTNVNILEGRQLGRGDSGKVVLGYNYRIENKIFPKAYSLNEKINIQGEDFRIVGFYEPIGTPQDDSQIYFTNDEIKALYGDSIKGYGYLLAKVDTKDIKAVIANVERSLRNSRNLKIGHEDFFVQSWEELIATYSTVLNSIIGFVILIALISVVVSAVNTANTMITSVLERFKEIGVMKAIGARNSEIFYLFLFESAFLGFIAGLLGVILGWIASSIAGKVLTNLGWGFLQPYYPWWLFLALIAFATITGAVSGAIPARYASKIKPVDALRYE